MKAGRKSFGKLDIGGGSNKIGLKTLTAFPKMKPDDLEAQKGKPGKPTKKLFLQ